MTRMVLATLGSAVTATLDSAVTHTALELVALMTLLSAPVAAKISRMALKTSRMAPKINRMAHPIPIYGYCDNNNMCGSSYGGDSYGSGNQQSSGLGSSDTSGNRREGGGGASGLLEKVKDKMHMGSGRNQGGDNY